MFLVHAPPQTIAIRMKMDVGGHDMQMELIQIIWQINGKLHVIYPNVKSHGFPFNDKWQLTTLFQYNAYGMVNASTKHSMGFNAL